jgi:hypothetical protein
MFAASDRKQAGLICSLDCPRFERAPAARCNQGTGFPERQSPERSSSNRNATNTKAMEEAVPDLIRLERYQGRAWSRQQRAIREFLNIKFTRAMTMASVTSGEGKRLTHHQSH